MIDLFASAPQYEAHLLPVWDLLPETVKGERVLKAPRLRNEAHLTPAMVASHLDMVRARGMGYRRFVYIEHGIGQSYGNGNPAYPGGRDRQHVALFLSPNQTAAEADRRVYPRATFRPVGDPRLDTLPARERGPALVCISGHWDCHVAPETRSAIRHFLPGLVELAKSQPLIGHCHPRARSWADPLYRRLGIEYVASFDEVCRRADLYICDNSSSMYEFAATGRPVVVLNAPWYRRNVNHGLRFWEAASVGLQVDEPEQLVDTVGEALHDPAGVRNAREEAVGIAYAYRSGAAQRASDAIVEWLA